MCGLAVILPPAGLVGDRKNILNNMLSKIQHRGPDSSGTHIVPEQVLIGHQRLAIIDIEHGQQPMCSDDGRYSLALNGEIYNFQELRKDLENRGVQFKTRSDTEVLLRMLIFYGPEAIKKLNGMFSFFFHDRKEGSWLAARDHFGIKPLYYAQIDKELVFASEIKSLLVHPKISSRRDDRSLKQYLSFQFCLDNRTLFHGIKKVKPGHYIAGSSATSWMEKAYWDLDYEVNYDKSEEWFVEQLRELLSDSVRLQMRSDVPIGTYLSGGIDSSLVSSLASQLVDDQLPMFHGRFTESPAYDESEYAKAMVDYTKGEYHEVVPTEHDFINDLPFLIYSLDEPLAGPGVFPQLTTSRLAANKVKVVLGGQGGDELFGGYARYLVGYLEQALKGSILETQEEGHHLVTLASIVPNLSLLKNYTPLLKHFWSDGLFSEMDQRYFHLIDRSQGIADILNEEFLETFDRGQVFADFQNVFNEPGTASYINKMTNFDQKTLLPALLQIEDRVSMSVSIESRVPLLDRRIADLSASMAPPLKFQGGHTKHILKKAAKDWLPRKVLERKDKMGFPVPLQEWMKGGIVREFVADTLLSSQSKSRGIFSEKALNAMIDDAGVGGRQLWGALSLELWHQEFIDG